MSDTITVTTDQMACLVWPPLKLADRSCAVPSAQALVRVVHGRSDLLFDGHSFAKHEANLIADGWTVYEDIRETL